MLKSSVTLTRAAAMEYLKRRGFTRDWEERKGKQRVQAKQYNKVKVGKNIKITIVNIVEL